jgi:hypothetical protein
MCDLLILATHLLVTVAKPRRRAPNLTTLDRFVLGLITLLVSSHRMPKLGALVKPATLLEFHQAMVIGNIVGSFDPRRIAASLVPKVLPLNSSRPSSR